MSTKTPGERLRELVKPSDQHKLIEYILEVSHRFPHTRGDRHELADMLEAEAAVSIHTNQPDEEHRGRLFLAASAAEPDGVAVVLDNVIGFWQTGELPKRWTA
jgi:hypothetical protein